MTLSIGWMPRVDGALSDEELVGQIRSGETALYEILMRRHNRRLYRVARSIVGNDTEAEDIMQEAYVRAYEHLDQFAGAARFSTWLTRIAVYEAFARLRRRGRLEDLESLPETALHASARGSPQPIDPERQAYNREMKVVLERAVDALPEGHRSVFVLRAVEGLSVAETALCLNVGEEAVKTRYHRARAFLRQQIQQQAHVAAPEIFSFHLLRCDRVVEAVLRRIQTSHRLR